MGMTREVAEKIVRGITDKIECNTVDIDDWAEFWGFTRDEYEEFLDMAIKVLEQQSSEDCISREAVEKITWEEPSYDDALNVLTEVRDKVRALPSVKPNPVFYPPCEDCNTKMNEVRRAYDKLKDLQPCEDCVSRYELSEAISALTYWHFNDDGKLEIGGAFDNTVYKVDDVERLERVLPSVTPSRAKGKWIHWTDDYKDYVTCSCCEYGEEGEVLLSDKTPFCPICGADMRESEANADE